ncbi:ParB/RepB/Spo0J family partition protein [Rothia sp. AR01]|uniref:ParB/RepB/Spo0J family partition protein n=1 Tax=Rothia santali TaxID=2949643 RepID=A0A9X2HE43_9MICC|nr:ParB/RepB/Spo0J family partition protein [Rothia santali]MCP3425147.1 ParB/RepB/Spo0J family partition protein [Rothia santali]
MTTQNATLEMIDPTALIVDTNVRSTPELGEDFIASIKHHGVLTPVQGYQAEDGVHIVAGQRRTLAAIRAELATIPVYVTDPAQNEGDQLAAQIVENIHRAELTDRDRAEGMEQLAAFGMDAGQIARALSTTRKEVKHTREVHASATGGKALNAGLTLDQAAILAEFEEHPEALARLETVAGDNPAQLTHSARSERSRIERETQRAAEHADAEARGAEHPGR